MGQTRVQLPDLMTTEQLAAEWQIKAKTLTNWRSSRVGPPFVKITGSVRYSRTACEAWLAEQQREQERARTA